MKIAVDAMGGDNAPAEIVRGAVNALAQADDISILFTGDEAQIRQCLSSLRYDAARVEILPTTEHAI